MDGERLGVAADALHAVEARLTPRARTSAATQHLAESLRAVGRVTIAFHPDRLDRRGLTAAAGLLADRAYLPQWITGASSGSRSAVAGGLRECWEDEVFGLHPQTPPTRRPVYGALDLLHHRHGGSPAFGSCFLVLRDEVRTRCSLSVGDSHLAPEAIGTFARAEAIAAELMQQAATGALLGQDLGVDDLMAVAAGERRDAPRRTLNHYVEVQVHGGVRLEDVDCVVVDPSFLGHEVEESLRGAADAAGADLQWHVGTAVAPDDLRHDPDAVDWEEDPAYLARLVGELARAAAPSPVATAADIGRLVADVQPGPPSGSGDPFRSPLQRVKHLWRLTYATGHDHRTGPSAHLG